MLLNRKLIESSDGIVRHHMTLEELRVKKALVQLLLDKGHSKYAERFWEFDFNIVDSKKHPDFTAAISFEDATVFISDGFIGTSKKIFDQLDVLLRHEMAHYLMMHFVRTLYIFKQRHANDPKFNSEQGDAWDRISSSASLHDLLNIIEDFEISNTRYSEADKQIVRTMTLNGEVIGGLITEEDHPGWETMPLEEMFNELVEELNKINKEIRTNPEWHPTKDGRPPRLIAPGKSNVDPVKHSTAKAMSLYADINAPTNIDGDFYTFIKSGIGKKLYGTGRYAKLLTYLFEQLKEYQDEQDKQPILEMLVKIAGTAAMEPFEMVHPKNGNTIEILYTPEEKYVACMLLKYLSKVKVTIKVTRVDNTPEFRDAYNKIVRELDKSDIPDSVLQDLAGQLEAHS